MHPDGWLEFQWRGVKCCTLQGDTKRRSLKLHLQVRCLLLFTDMRGRPCWVRGARRRPRRPQLSAETPARPRRGSRDSRGCGSGGGRVLWEQRLHVLARSPRRQLQRISREEPRSRSRSRLSAPSSVAHSSIPEVLAEGRVISLTVGPLTPPAGRRLLVPRAFLRHI